jgi:hypothetical protein
MKLNPRHRHKFANGVEITIETDGSPFEMFLSFYVFSLNEPYYAKIEDLSGKKVTLELPLMNFKINRVHRYYTEEKPAFLEWFGFQTSEENNTTERKFSLKVHEANFIYSPTID